MTSLAVCGTRQQRHGQVRGRLEQRGVGARADGERGADGRPTCESWRRVSTVPAPTIASGTASRIRRIDSSAAPGPQA